MSSFRKYNSIRLAEANPDHTDKYGPDSFEIGPIGKTDDSADLFRGKLSSFFYYKEKKKKFFLPKRSSSGKLVVICPAEYEQPPEHWPPEYFGYKVDYHPETQPPPLRSEPRTGEAGGHQAVVMGLKIADSNEEAVNAVIAAIVREKHGTRRFALTALHVFHSTAKLIAAASVDGRASHPIGTIVRRFTKKRGGDSRYNCLHDVLAIELAPDTIAGNKLDGLRIVSTKSSLAHFYYGSRVVLLDKRRIGEVRHPLRKDYVHNRENDVIGTDGFTVMLDVDVPAAIPPGSPVFTEHRELLGMAISRTGQTLFCLDMDDVIARLGCVLS